MLRARLDFELDIIPTESGQNFQASETALGIMLTFSVIGLVLQLGCAIAAVWNYRDRLEAVGDGIEVGQPLVYLGKVICRVGLTALATTTSGLLAVKRVLAGKPVNFAALASFILVTVSTQLLVTISQIAHLRNSVVKAAISRQVRIQFSGIGHLLESGAGRTCVVHRCRRLWQLLPWLCTNIGILAWANAGLVGIGASAWKDLEPVGKILMDKAPAKAVGDFLDELGADGALQERHCCSFFSWASGASSLSSEDERLLKNRVVQIWNAFPTSPRLRLLHGLIVVLSNMCSSAIPTMFIGAQDMSLKMELPSGQASIFSFCRNSQCTHPQIAEYESSLLLQSRIKTHEFGTCNLNLNGMRFRQHKFTVLAIQGCAMSARLGNVAAELCGFRIGSHNYEATVVNSNLGAEAEVVMSIKPELDTSNIKASSMLRGCANRAYETWRDVKTKPEIGVSQQAKARSFNLTFRIGLSPHVPVADVHSTYSFSVKLEETTGLLSGLQGHLDALEDFDGESGNSATRSPKTSELRDL